MQDYEKIFKKIYESSEDFDEDEDFDEEDNESDGDYKIERIKQDNSHKYEYCDGVMYRCSDNDTTLSIERIEATPENTFYEDQIERYVEYIKDGGIIDTFPVSESPLANHLEDMLELMDCVKYSSDLDKDFDREIFRQDSFLNKYQYELSNFFEKDEFPQYCRLNRSARNLKGCFDNEDLDEAEKELLTHLKFVFDFFDDNKEYTLIDFNHRFEAVKRIGCKEVLVEVMN